MTDAYWKDRLRHRASEVLKMDEYNKMQKKVEEAENAFCIAEATLENVKGKLDKLNEGKTISPKEILEEMDRMIGCPEWEDTLSKNLGKILVRNIFHNREIKAERKADLYDRDY